MKNITNIILVALLLLVVKSSLAQNTGVAYIENPLVDGLVFSWELHFERTNDWTAGLLTNALGSSSPSFDFDTSGLASPSLVIAAGGPLDNANYTGVTVQIINGKCIVDIPFALNALAGQLPLNVKTKLLTVSMAITNTSLTAGLSWDALNTGFFDNNDATVVTTLTGSSNTPLPVELTTFTAAYNNHEVKLSWETATELNNYGFEIERKVVSDQSPENNFEKIGFVNGSGNSNSPKKYSFSDTNVSGGNKFAYRLKQMDNEGQVEYSDVVEVSVVPDKFELSQNYPNPFNPGTKIKFSIPQIKKRETQVITLKVYDILGNEVATLMNKELSAGVYEVNFNSNGLASGFYIYKLTTNGFSETKKMLLLK